MSIDKLVEQYKTFDELKLFCEQQFKQILSLTKKNRELEDKLAVSKVFEPTNLPVPQGTDLKVLDDAKTISQVQIQMLKQTAFGRELTLEETKKLEIFNKILNQQEEKDKPLRVNAKVLGETDLLKLIENA